LISPNFLGNLLSNRIILTNLMEVKI
jgi:hypothetical protein